MTSCSDIFQHLSQVPIGKAELEVVHAMFISKFLTWCLALIFFLIVVSGAIAVLRIVDEEARIIVIAVSTILGSVLLLVCVFKFPIHEISGFFYPEWYYYLLKSGAFSGGCI